MRLEKEVREKMQNTWFQLTLLISVLLYVAAEFFSVWRVRKSKQIGNEVVRWDWAWFCYPGVTLGLLIVLAWYGWGMNP